VPANEPPLRFFGPSPLEFSAASVPCGAGVEADSDALSLISGIFKVDLSSSAGAGDEATEAGDSSSDLTCRERNRRSCLGGSLNMTILLCFLFLSARVGAEGDLVLDEDIVGL
jgi:hypothetical protein